MHNLNALSGCVDGVLIRTGIWFSGQLLIVFWKQWQWSVKQMDKSWGREYHYYWWGIPCLLRAYIEKWASLWQKHCSCPNDSQSREQTHTSIGMRTVEQIRYIKISPDFIVNSLSSSNSSERCNPVFNRKLQKMQATLNMNLCCSHDWNTSGSKRHIRI